MNVKDVILLCLENDDYYHVEMISYLVQHKQNKLANTYLQKYMEYVVDKYK